MNDRDKTLEWFREVMKSGSPVLPVVIPGRWHPDDSFRRWVPQPGSDCRCYARPVRRPPLRLIQGGKQ